MARPLRLEFPGALYHITARGNAQQAIFVDDTDRQRFLQLLGREVLQQRWRCYVYCLMGNHYHMVIETPEPTLSRGLRRLHGTYTQWFNRRHHRVGHVLQGRYKSVLVEKDSYLQELCRYVVLNPVRAGLVPEVQAWPWSSYHVTVGVKAEPAWLDCAAVLSLFDRDPVRARRAYRRFVADGIRQPSPWHQVTSQIFLGRPAFLERMAQLVRGKSVTNVPRAHTQPSRLSSDQVLEHVAVAYRLQVPRIVDRSHRAAYQTAVYLLRRVANEPLRAVAVRFRISPSRVSKIQKAMEAAPLSAQQVQAYAKCQVKN